jgi:hypothetical protein
VRADRETEVKTMSIGLYRYKIHDGASLASVEGLDDLVIARRNSCGWLEISIAAVMLSVANNYHFPVSIVRISISNLTVA